MFVGCPPLRSSRRARDRKCTSSARTQVWSRAAAPPDAHPRTSQALGSASMVIGSLNPPRPGQTWTGLTSLRAEEWRGRKLQAGAGTEAGAGQLRLGDNEGGKRRLATPPAVSRFRMDSGGLTPACASLFWVSEPGEAPTPARRTRKVDAGSAVRLETKSRLIDLLAGWDW